MYDPTGSPVHRVGRDDPNTISGQDAVFVRDVAIYDSQGLLHADIDTVTGGYNAAHLDPVGYKGQSGQYTDLETVQAVSGLYTALSGPVGANFYNPMSGVGMARSQSDSINTYLDNLNPLAGYTFGAYAQTAGEFAVGEAKGFANFGAGLMVEGPLSHPFAASNENQANGASSAETIATVASFFTGEGEVAAVEGGAAKTLAGAESKAAARGSLHSIGDPLADVLGPAHTSHPEEFEAILNHLDQSGVDTRFRTGQNGYTPGLKPGEAGQVRLDPDASIGAVRHEYQHFLDDEAAGRPGIGHYYENANARWRLERRAYMLELGIAKRLGNQAARRQLIKNALEEKRSVYGR